MHQSAADVRHNLLLLNRCHHESVRQKIVRVLDLPAARPTTAAGVKMVGDLQ
jgi:hypothetical protein